MKYKGSFGDGLGIESRVEIERVGVEGEDREIVFTEFGVQLFRDGLDLWDPIYSQGCEIGVWIEEEGWYEDLFFGTDIWGVMARVWRGGELVFVGRVDGELMDMELRRVPRELVISCVDGLGDLDSTTADIRFTDGVARVGDVVLSCLRCIGTPFNVRLNSDLYLDLGGGDYRPVMDALVRREALEDDRDEYGRMRVAREVLRDVLMSFGLRLSWGRGVWRLDRLRNVVDRVFGSESEYAVETGVMSSVVAPIREVWIGGLHRNSFVRRPRVRIDSGYGRMRVNWDPRMVDNLTKQMNGNRGILSSGFADFFGASLLPKLARIGYTTISYSTHGQLSCNEMNDYLLFDFRTPTNSTVSYGFAGVAWRFGVKSVRGRSVVLEMNWAADDVAYFVQAVANLERKYRVTFRMSVVRSDGLFLKETESGSGVYVWVGGERSMFFSTVEGTTSVGGKVSVKIPIDEGGGYDYAMVVYPGTVFFGYTEFSLTFTSRFYPLVRSNYRIWGVGVRVVDDEEVENSFVAAFPVGYPRNAPVLDQRLMTTTGDINVVNTLLKDRWTEIGGVVDVGRLGGGVMSLLEWMVDDRMDVWRQPRRVVECEVGMDDLVLSGDRVRIEGEDGVYVVLGYRHLLLEGESRVSVMEIG